MHSTDVPEASKADEEPEVSGESEGDMTEAAAAAAAQPAAAAGQPAPAAAQPEGDQDGQTSHMDVGEDSAGAGSRLASLDTDSDPSGQEEEDEDMDQDATTAKKGKTRGRLQTDVKTEAQEEAIVDFYQSNPLFFDQTVKEFKMKAKKMAMLEELGQRIGVSGECSIKIKPFLQLSFFSSAMQFPIYPIFHVSFLSVDSHGGRSSA